MPRTAPERIPWRAAGITNVKACLIDEQLHNNFKHNEEPVKVRSQLAIYEYLKNKS